MIKGMEDALFICFGNHPKSNENREYGKRVLEVLRVRDYVFRRELFELLDLNPDLKKDEVRFMRVMQRLRGKNVLKVRMVDRDDMSREPSYALSFSAFSAGIDAVKEHVKTMAGSKKS